jgi:hypothetical protein
VTTFGWDASDYDWDRGPMDLGAARRDGIDFFTHKLTEGATWRAVHAQTALTRARTAGVPFLGGYHVVRSGTSSAAQVANLLGYADAIVPWWRTYPGWFWQVDLELWGYDNVSAAKGKEFTDALRGAQRKNVVMYASRGQYGDSLSGVNAELWNANYGANPIGHYRELYPGDGSSRWTAYSGKTPKILQYGSRLTIGSQPTCDANAFRGTVADLGTTLVGGAGVDETERRAANADQQINAILRDEDTATVFTNITGGTGLQPNDLKKHRANELQALHDQIDAVRALAQSVADRPATTVTLDDAAITALAQKIAPLVNVPSLQDIEDAAYRGANRAEDS